MTAIAAAVKPKRTSGRSRWRAASNVRRVRKLDRKTRPTDSNNIFRWYRAGWGRMTQPDPLEPGGLGVFSDSELLTFASLRVRSSRREATQQPPLPYSRAEAPYTYAAANPISFTDPDGLNIVPCTGGGTNPSRLPDYYYPHRKKPNRTPAGRLIGTCPILLVCADPPRMRVYTTVITHVQPCPPCPGPTDCVAWVDTATSQVDGKVICKSE